MGKIKNLEIEFMVGNYGLLFYTPVDSKNNFTQRVQIYSRITDELVYEEKITKHKDVSRLIHLISKMHNLECQNGIHIKDSSELFSVDELVA
jgi:hypothetical protein